MKKMMKKNQIITLCVISFTLALAWVGFHTKSEEVVQPREVQLQTAQGFELYDFNQKKHSLSDLKGKILLVHFWATWCEPCLDEIPEWIELAHFFQNEPISFIAINEDKNWEEAHKTLPSSKLLPKMLSLLDVKTKVASQWGTYQFPETYLINSEQKILMKWVGPQNWKDQETRDWIQHWIDKKTSNSTRLTQDKR